MIEDTTVSTPQEAAWLAVFRGLDPEQRSIMMEIAVGYRVAKAGNGQFQARQFRVIRGGKAQTANVGETA